MTNTTRQTKKNNKKEPETVDLNVCALCLCSEDDVEKYGKFFRCSTQELAVHEYCLFFASGLAQNGEDHEGFDGFLHHDIKEEIKRASKLRCTVCHRKGAATGCCVLKCGSTFHFACGLQKNALFQFFDSFRAFCKRHRPAQKILHTCSSSVQTPSCPICLNDVDVSDNVATLKSPCCINAWFHRSCVQKQALANGMYYFRCAFCNNFDEFQDEMRQMGIYIPDRDAIWEQGDAYVELLHQHNRCDATNCVCPKGREFSGRYKGQRWKIYKCFACGQCGTHRWCQQPQFTRRFLCQNCVVCFPQHGQEKNYTLTSTTSENSILDDSQSTTFSSQHGEITQELNASTETENIPLSQLIKQFQTINNDNCKDECNSSAGSETTSLPIEDRFSCKGEDTVCSLDDYTTMVSSDESTFVDVDNLSTNSSCTLSIDSDVSSFVGNPKAKPKDKKRKPVAKQNKAVKQNTKSNLKTKAQRKAKREELKKKRAQQQEKPRRKKTTRNRPEMSTKSKTSNKNANDSFCLALSPESDSQVDDSKTSSPKKYEDEMLFLSLDEDCNDKCTFDGLVSNTSLNELVSITSKNKNSATTGNAKIAEGKTGSSMESDLHIEADSVSSLSIPSKSSDNLEMSISSGKKKLLQRDIRSMFTSQTNNSTSIGKSPVKFVEDQCCQTEPMKIHRGNKRRKLSTSLSEYKSITTFMSVNDSSPKRKSPKGKLQDVTLNSTLPNEEAEPDGSTLSNSIMETMTAAKGMVMRALKRLGGSSEVSKETDAATPRKSLFRDTDINNTESWKNDLSEVRDDALVPSSRTTRKSTEGTDSDSSDSIKVVKVKKGRTPNRPRDIPKVIKMYTVPNHIHEKFCACYNIHAHKRLMPKKSIEPSDPSEVIVIDDENDDQDSGKGSSRNTSDEGTKSDDGSGLEDQESSPCKEENSRKSSKKLKTNVKKRAEYNKNCTTSISDELDVLPKVLFEESLEKSYFTEKHLEEREDRDNTFESQDSLMDECTENNFKGGLKKKSKSHASKKAEKQGHGNLSPLTQKSKSNLSSKNAKPIKKKYLSLKRYMECSDEDFQSKRNLASRSKGIKSTRPSNTDQDQTKKRKKKKSGTREKLGNSSCTATVSTVADNEL